MDFRSVKIFISSPGDVRPERLVAQSVIARLGKEFSHYLQIESVMWEREPLVATEHFQTNITPPSETDLVVCILWSRLGSYLPVDEFRGALSGGQVTGTEWEFEDAVCSWQVRGAPQVLVYRKTVPVLVDARNSEQRRLVSEQWDLLQRFHERWFIDSNQTGFKGAWYDFASTAELSNLLEVHLTALLRDFLPAVATSGQDIPIRWHQGSPFRGLLPFEVQHAPIFFGRTRARSELRDALASQIQRGVAFVLVTGMSGVGKSSLVKAGLIPDLATPGMVESIALLRWCSISPGRVLESDGLVHELANALLQETGLPELIEAGFDAHSLARTLGTNLSIVEEAIGSALERAATTGDLIKDAQARLLIVLDQLEELVSAPHQEGSDRDQFVTILNSLARCGLVWVVATMRSDFYSNLPAIPMLMALSEGRGTYHLAPPTTEEIGRMIRGPASEAGLIFESDSNSGVSLDEVIQHAASNAPGALPLLEFTLDQLFESLHGSRVLTFSSYRALGELEGAIGQRAEAVFGGLPSIAQSALPALLWSLVAVSADADAKPSFLWCSLSLAGQTAEQRTLIDALRAARLLVSDVGSDGSTAIRFVHEALLTHWPRITEWLEEERDGLVARARLTAEAERWQSEDGSDELLLMGSKRLKEARNVLNAHRQWLSPSTVAFIEHSLASEQEREALHNAEVEAQKKTRQAVESADEIARRPLWSAGGLIGAAIIIAFVLLHVGGWTGRVQAAWFDAYQALRPRQVVSTPATVVEIDEKSLAALGQWPWPRAQLAQLVRTIAQAQPAAIAVNILMPEPDALSAEQVFAHRPHQNPEAAVFRSPPSNDRELAGAFSAAHAILVFAGTPEATGMLLRAPEFSVRESEAPTAASTSLPPRRAPPFSVRDSEAPTAASTSLPPGLAHYAGVQTSIDVLDRAAFGRGLISVETTGGVIRRIPLVANVNDNLVPALAVEMLRVALQEPSLQLLVAGASARGIAIGDFVIPTDADGAVRIYYSRRDGRRIVSALDVLEGKVDPARLQQKLVLIGVTGQGLVDYKNTSIGEPMPDSEIHAQLLENLYDHTILLRPSTFFWIELVLILAGGAGMLVLVNRVPAWTSAVVAVSASVVLLTASWLLFTQRYELLDPTLAIATIFALLAQQLLTRADRFRKQWKLVRVAVDGYVQGSPSSPNPPNHDT